MNTETKENLVISNSTVQQASDRSSNQIATVAENEPTSTPKGTRFWLVFLGLCLAGFISSTDSTIIFTILPTITADLDGQSKYIWLGNAYTLTATSVQPLFGQLSDIFGRRYPMVVAVALFALGSGLAGGANSADVFIVARLIQGLGAGGMIMLIDLIVCDLLPLRERSQYLGIVLSACAVGTLIGPVIGGAIAANVTWKWAFWINLPISVLTLAILIPFLRLTWKRSSWKHSLARIDYLGNVIFIASVVSILLGIIQGGVIYPWNSWRTILPIVLGVVGLGVFFAQQAYCKEPTMPLRLFAHRTSAATYFLNLIVSIMLQWCIFVLPLYFQSQLGASPLTSGIDILPLNAFLIPSAAVAGALLTKTGKYKPLHWAGFAVLAVACGLFSTLDATSNRAAWVCYQIIAAVGIGLPLTTQLPAIQAVLPESDTAVSTSTYAFIRSFGFVWGATIPSIIFNAGVDSALHVIDDPGVRAALAGGGAYDYVANVRSLHGDTLSQTLGVYASALRLVWCVGVGLSTLGFLCVFIEKHVDMRATLETEFGLEQKKRSEEPEAAASRK